MVAEALNILFVHKLLHLKDIQQLHRLVTMASKKDKHLLHKLVIMQRLVYLDIRLHTLEVVHRLEMVHRLDVVKVVKVVEMVVDRLVIDHNFVVEEHKALMLVAVSKGHTMI